jgi:Proline dehydrogenase
METPQQKKPVELLTGLLARSGRGIIRKAVDVAMRMMGEQFVTGETIDEALKNAERLEDKGFQYSYDMLGEAALTDPDAERYYQDYQDAIHAIGKASTDKMSITARVFLSNCLHCIHVINVHKWIV